jgi:microcystin-dependent protein
MAFSSKDDAKTNMTSTITSPTDPYLTPSGSINRVRATNLKNWLTEFLDWVFPTPLSGLKGKSPVVSTNNTDYGAITWQQIVPIGTVMPWAGAGSAPDGYLFCDGSSVSDTTYADLHAVIGNNYGTPSSGQFILPNMEGRIPLGFDSGSSTTPSQLNNDPTLSNYGKIGNRGGLRNVSLSLNQLASHTHTAGTYYAHANSAGRDSLHNHPGFDTSNGDGGDNRVFEKGENYDGVPNNTTGYGGRHTHDIIGNSGNTGSGRAHENRMPYVVMKYIIKT